MKREIPNKEREGVDSEAILSVFRELGIENEDGRENFKKLAELGDWTGWSDKSLEPQDTRGNTMIRDRQNNA